MSIKRRKPLDKSRGLIGKTAVVVGKDRDSGEVRDEVVQRTNGATLTGFSAGKKKILACKFSIPYSMVENINMDLRWNDRNTDLEGTLGR